MAESLGGNGDSARDELNGARQTSCAMAAGAGNPRRVDRASVRYDRPPVEAGRQGSSAAGELARQRVDPHLLVVGDVLGDLDFDAGVELGRLGALGRAGTL